ncbi:MAG: urease accessory protein UreH [Pyrinomonadaceae bacterium]
MISTEFVLTAGSVSSVLGLGFFLGLKHATEADHLAAVATVVAEKKDALTSTLVGGVWGAGHTISLFVAGLIVLLLKFQISERLEAGLEFCVGIMLAILGLNVFRKLYSGGHLHLHEHKHGETVHIHPHIHVPAETDDPHTHHGLSFSPRSLIVGMIHGLAGSAALMLLIIPTIDSTALGLVYIAVFGAGSIGGMMLMSFLVSLPFMLTSNRFDMVNRLLQVGAGSFSVVLGFWIIYEKGVAEGLLF